MDQEEKSLIKKYCIKRFAIYHNRFQMDHIIYYGYYTPQNSQKGLVKRNNNLNKRIYCFLCLYKPKTKEEISQIDFLFSDYVIPQKFSFDNCLIEEKIITYDDMHSVLNEQKKLLKKWPQEPILILNKNDYEHYFSMI